MIIRGIALLGAIGVTYSHITQAASINFQDKPALQRGAKVFMNYCSGCHSLKYMRYNQMAKGLGLVGFDGQVDENLLKNNLIFTQALINDPIRVALPPEDAKQWFGVVPPDLSLIVREKGGRWLFRYLKTFYNDDTKPFGVNNSLVPDVAMPNVLDSIPVAEFEEQVQDLVAFLAYVGEPEAVTRQKMGGYVMAFLFVFLLAVLGLQKAYDRRIGRR